MRPAARYLAAGVVAAALGAGPVIAQAQSADPAGSSSSQGGTQSGTSSPGASSTGTSSTQATQPSTTKTTSSSSSGVDEAAAREHLSQARQALAELTKLPAATQLQGEQRTTIANFIQAFNAFATATTDWKSKFQIVDEQLDQILASAEAGAGSGTAGTAGSATGTASSGSTTNPESSTAGATGATGSAATSGGYDATIVAKLREVRQHLDAFQEASGDPAPHLDAIEKIIESAATGTSGSSAVGTSGTTGGASSAGSVTLTRAQLDEIRQHVEKLRQLTNR